MNFTFWLPGDPDKSDKTYFPTQADISSPAQMVDAIGQAHVCSAFLGNCRSKLCFKQSNVICMVCDNKDSLNPVAQKDITEIFKDCQYILVPDNSPLPSFQVYFPITCCTNANAYEELQKQIQKKHVFFSKNKKNFGAACLLDGIQTNAGDIIWHEADLTIDQILPVPAEKDDSIKDKNRNTKLAELASFLIKANGLEQAHEQFITIKDKCQTPIGTEELNAIWETVINDRQLRIIDKKLESVTVKEDDTPDIPLKPSDYSDIGQAEILTKHYTKQVCFARGGGWAFYNGTTWVFNAMVVQGMMQKFTGEQLKAALDAVDKAKKECIENHIPLGKISKKLELSTEQLMILSNYQEAAAFQKFVLQRRDSDCIKSAMYAAIPMVLKDITDFDKDPYLLNTPDCTIDLRLGAAGARPHSPDDYLSKQTVASPGAEGEDLWQEVLDRCFGKNQELIVYVQRIVGMAAIGEVNIESLIIAYGSGANGKSTFWNAIQLVLGTYAGIISADILTVNMRRNSKPEIAELLAKRLVIASELREGMRLDTAILKQLCSTDKIMGEKKYEAPFDFVPNHTLVLYTNHLPKVGTNDHGTWRRILVIPFTQTIPKEIGVVNYAQYLKTHAAPAIMAWIVEGARLAYAENFKFKTPQVILDAVEKYRESNDWLKAFIEDCCEVGEKKSVSSGALYQTYRKYSTNMGEFIRCTADFYAALEEAGYTKKRYSGKRLICGLELKANPDFDQDTPFNTAEIYG